MKYQIENSAGAKYDFIESITNSGRKWMIEFSDLSPRIGTQPRYGKSGGVETGDLQFDTRNASLSFDLATQTDAESISIASQITAIFRRDRAPFYLNRFLDTNATTTPDHRTRVVMTKFGRRSKTDGTDRRLDSIRLSLELMNTFWEDYTEQQAQQLAIVNNGSLVCSNGGEEDSYPIIKVKALSSLNSRFTILNATTGASITIENLSFSMNRTFTLDFDSSENNILLEGVESSLSISNGGPFVLVPGNNTIVYQSNDGNADLTINWRRQYRD